ncbi:MAG: alpha/beta fold hydrolase [Acidobacteria bacterium]|nr:alpha/beta fold hydrolase [Acidobacteriota bacterium]
MKIRWSDSDPDAKSVPIIFLHAFPLSGEMWRDQIATLSHDHRTITLDWPGFGESPLSSLADKVNGSDGLYGYASCLLNLIDQLEISRANLCGLSMGGYIALRFFRLAPERVNSLILCDTRATADTPEVRSGRYETAAAIRRDGLMGVEHLATRMVERLLGSSTLSSNPNLVIYIKHLITRNSPEGIAKALEAMAERRDCSDLLPVIGGLSQIKVKIIVGEEDKLTPPSEMLQMAESIPNSSLQIIDGAGHLPNLEQPLIFNQSISEFLPRSMQ